MSPWWKTAIVGVVLIASAAIAYGVVVLAHWTIGKLR
jgi:hypothetical protein